MTVGEFNVGAESLTNTISGGVPYLLVFYNEPQNPILIIRAPILDLTRLGSMAYNIRGIWELERFKNQIPPETRAPRLRPQ